MGCAGVVGGLWVEAPTVAPRPPDGGGLEELGRLVAGIPFRVAADDLGRLQAPALVLHGATTRSSQSSTARN